MLEGGKKRCIDTMPHGKCITFVNFFYYCLKGRHQKLLSGFFLLRVLWQDDFLLKGGGGVLHPNSAKEYSAKKQGF